MPTQPAGVVSLTHVTELGAKLVSYSLHRTTAHTAQSDAIV